MLQTIWIFIITYCGLSFVQCQDRVAPGVPPQHYQQVSCVLLTYVLYKTIRKLTFYFTR